MQQFIVISILLLVTNMAFAAQNIWQLDRKRCQLSYQTAHFSLSTDGYLSNDSIYFKLTSTAPLHATPNVLFTANDRLIFTVIGNNRTYGFEFPYRPLTIKQMRDLSTAFVINYQPLGRENSYYKAVISTAGLPEAISTLSQTCHK